MKKHDKIESTEQIELRSEEFQEILGSIPNWILRWGITTLAFIVSIILAICWFVKYPDSISSSMILTNETPPVAIVSRSNGKLSELFIQDKQRIKKNDYLAVIENPASTKDILYLKTTLEKIISRPDSIIYLEDKEMNLGSVQELYSSFYRSLSNYRRFLEQNYYPQKIKSIEKRIKKNHQYSKHIYLQKEITEQQYEIALMHFKRDSLLSVKNIVTTKETEDLHSRLLQNYLSLEETRASVENTKIQICQLEESLLDVKQQYFNKRNSFELDLVNLTIQLMNEIRTWEQTFALTSPIDGIVTFNNYWSKNQNVSSGETVFSIIPIQTGELIGKAQLPIVRSGKVKVGQQVNIHFLNYPDNEFGIVNGVVKSISIIPTNGNYNVEISLPNGLRTTYKIELPLSREMPAQADIITEDLRLIERLIMPIKKVLYENF